MATKLMKTFALTQRGFKSIDLANATIKELFGIEADGKLSPQRAYHKQGWFRRCVQIRVQALVGMPWEIKQNDDVVWSSTDDKVPEGLEALESLPSMLALTEASLAMHNQAFMLKLRKTGRFKGLQWWDPTTVRIVKDAAVGISQFKREVNGDQKPYDPEDVLYVRQRDIYTEIGTAGSDGQSALIHADVLHSLSTFQDKYLDRGLTKATILTVEEDVDPKELKRLESWWNRWFSGVDNAGQQKVINNAVTPVVIGEGLKDLSDVDLTEDQERQLATAFGVPHSLVMSDASNFATKKADQIDFYLFTVIPQSIVIVRAFNRQLLNALGLHLVFHPQKLELFQQYELEKAKAITSIVGEPVLTVDEGRELLGKEPFKRSQVGMEEGLEEDELSEEKRLDIRRWRAKIKNTGNRLIKFNPDSLSESESITITQRLIAGKSIEEAFKLPLVDFQ